MKSTQNFETGRHREREGEPLEGRVSGNAARRPLHPPMYFASHSLAFPFPPFTPPLLPILWSLSMLQPGDYNVRAMLLNHHCEPKDVSQEDPPKEKRKASEKGDLHMHEGRKERNGRNNILSTCMRTSTHTHTRMHVPYQHPGDERRGQRGS